MRTNNYVQLDPAVIEQERQMDLLSYESSYDCTRIRYFRWTFSYFSR